MTLDATCIRRKSYRMMFRFWLDIEKDDEYHLAEQIQILKVQRQFTSAIRDSLRLILDLRAGKTDVLLEMFPFVKDAIPQESRGVEEQLTRLERLLLNSGNTPINLPAGPKPMAIPKLDKPIYDDDTPQLRIKKAESDGQQSAKNFLDSAFALLN